MTATKHKNDCKMAWGKKDVSCPRCQELLSGDAPRSGWQADYYKNKKREEEQRTLAIKNHSCIERKCGNVCTAFEW